MPHVREKRIVPNTLHMNIHGGSRYGAKMALFPWQLPPVNNLLITVDYFFLHRTAILLHQIGSFCARGLTREPDKTCVRRRCQLKPLMEKRLQLYFFFPKTRSVDSSLTRCVSRCIREWIKRGIVVEKQLGYNFPDKRDLLMDGASAARMAHMRL